jgi:hypothetical protein
VNLAYVIFSPHHTMFFGFLDPSYERTCGRFGIFFSHWTSGNYQVVLKYDICLGVLFGARIIMFNVFLIIHNFKAIG